MGQEHLAESGVVRGEELLQRRGGWSTSHLMICDGRARSYVTRAAANLSRFSSC